MNPKHTNSSYSIRVPLYLVIFLLSLIISAVFIRQGFSDQESVEEKTPSSSILSGSSPLHQNSSPENAVNIDNERKPRSPLEGVYKHLVTQTDTPFNRFMGDFVGTFLVVGLMIFLPATLIVYLMDLEAFWKKLSVFFIIVYTFFLLNYMIWLISKNEPLSKSFMMFSGFIWIFLGVFVVFFKKSQTPLGAPKDKTEHWICQQCKSENRHSIRCWNCGADRVLKER